jgi:sialate O-acetylesterase
MLANSTIKQLCAFSFSFLLCFLLTSSALAQLTVSPIFGSNMVLQRGATVPVFGTSGPGTTVTIQFNGQNKSVVTDASGKWRADLSSMTASSSPSSMTVTSGTSSVTFTGVQVGEVWFCSGQSNMGWPLNNADNSAAAIADAGKHNIRLFRMTAGNGPSTTTWQVSNSNTVANFSAVGYWMGLELSRWFGNVPIGLIQATHDGTAIEHWQHTSGGIGDDYDAMVKAIQPFAVKGVAWYQGESNGGDAAYRTKLTNMIREWRGDWGQAALPFGIIQLAYRSGWNVARNAQLEAADTEPECFLVVIRDLPGGSLHPTVKKPVGIRTAIGARGMVYGENIPYSGPIRDVAKSFVSGNKIILNWKFPGNGLFTNDGKAPGGFSVATATGQFKAATAAIVGNTVEIISPVAGPARVQYAYSSIGNLYNRVSIPTEGGTVMVDRLKASEFQITLSSSAGTTMSQAFTSANISSELQEISVTVYPNPAPGGRFHVNLGRIIGGTKLSIQINDAQGKVVYQKDEVVNGVLPINSRLQPGMYLLQIKSDAGTVHQQKLMVQ